MSEIKNYRKISLGHREEQFLSMIAEEEMTVYKIYSKFNEARTELKKRLSISKDDFDDILVTAHEDEGMAYKNVHKRVKRLETLGLIENTQEKQSRNGIKYRLTSRGLFQCLLQTWNGPQKTILYDKYENDAILRTILYQYFEVETVKKLMEIFGGWFFDRFLMKCCQEIQSRVDGIFYELEEEITPNLQKMWPYYYPDKIGRRLELVLDPESPNGEFIDRMIKNEAKNLMYRIFERVHERRL